MSPFVNPNKLASQADYSSRPFSCRVRSWRGDANWLLPLAQRTFSSSKASSAGVRFNHMISRITAIARLDRRVVVKPAYRVDD